jgi:predicted membrane chloride channel (bestrophin family)
MTIPVDRLQTASERDPWLRRGWLFGRVVLLLLSLLAAKVLVHRLHWEPLAPNPLFPALVASEVFLMGFLLNGVLLDYKEGERIPAELAAALECLARETMSVRECHPDAEVTPALELLAAFSEDLLVWVGHARPVAALLDRLEALQLAVDRLGRCNPAPLQARLLLELANIRRAVHRIEVIRATIFVPSVYGMAYIGTGLLTVGLVLTDIEPFGESLFFIGVISFLLIKLLLLITDLDNPFGTGEAMSVENVSLRPLGLAVERLRLLAAAD